MFKPIVEPFPPASFPFGSDIRDNARTDTVPFGASLKHDSPRYGFFLA